MKEIGSHSAVPILSPEERQKYIPFEVGDMLDYQKVEDVLQRFRPDAIVHFAEQPAAPYSMIDVQHAVFTQKNNVLGTLNLLWAMKEICPDAHLIKLGTMGEYGTPNIDISEGFFEIEFRGRKDRLPFPKQAGSWYHQTKVHDSNNILFACRIWGLRSTDINQGPVYGSKTDEMKEDWQRTRFDFDQSFGTALNRFCSQAVIGFPLTPYGRGGQIRGYININDSMQAIRLIIDNPPKQGEYRVFNQWIEKFSINQLAEIVKQAAEKIGLKVTIQALNNPRKEAEEHYYNPDNQGLFRLGLKPRGLKEVVPQTIKDLIKFKDRIEAKKDFIKPTIKWA